VLTRQPEDDKAAAMTDGYEKELTIENLRYKEKSKISNVRKKPMLMN
jgi:hypothetical protein